MATSLFIQPLPSSITDAQLKQLFEPFGVVVWARVLKSHHGAPLGFGYLEMLSEEEANKAVKELDGRQIEDCRLAVTMLSVSPLILEAQRFLTGNPGKAFCDICLLSHAQQPPVISTSHALGMLIRHFQTTSHGTCVDCGKQTLVIMARPE